MIRRPFTFLTLLVALGAGAVTLHAQAPAAAPTVRPEIGPDHPYAPLPRREETLPNGLRIIVVQKPTVPKVTTILTVRSGMASDPDGLPGLASLTAEAIQEGTSARDSRQIRQEAFGMGASLTATVSQDYTTVTLRGLAEFLPGLLDLLSDVTTRPTFPESEVTLIKTNRLQAIQQQKADPSFLSERTFRQALFGTHPYARISSTPDAVQTIDRARLAAFHSDHYRPNNAFLLVIGDVAPETVVAAARKVFGSWTQKPVTRTPPAAAAPFTGRRLIFVQRPNSVQSAISVGNFAAKRTDPLWYALQVTNTIYGGAFNSRIVRNIREDKGYTYSPFSQFGSLADAGFYRFAASVRNEVTGPALKEVYGEIDKLRAEGAGGPELDSVKRYLKGIFVITTATQSGLSNAVNNLYAFGLPADYLETYQSRISAVTLENVRSAAAALLGSDNSVVVIVGDYPKVKDQLGAFSNVSFVDIDGKPIAQPGG